MKVKICGLVRPEDIRAVNRAGADYAGFVFAESRRQVRQDVAARLIRMLRGPQAVGVFVSAPLEAVAETAEAAGLSVIQLHGDEDAAYLAELRARISLPIWKGVRPRSAEELFAADALGADALVVDAYVPGAYGGTGVRGNWELLRSVHLDTRWFVAGGLTPENVAEAAALAPYGVDVSGGVETAGWKDAAKIYTFVEHVRREASKIGKERISGWNPDDTTASADSMSPKP